MSETSAAAVDMTRLSTSDPDFSARLDALLAWEGVSDHEVQQRVADIIAGVRERGDAALVDYTHRFDRLNVTGMAELTLDAARLEQAYRGLPQEQRDALTQAAERIRLYHEHQKSTSWSYVEDDGTVLGQQVTPLDRAGIYVPGGKAA